MEAAFPHTPDQQADTMGKLIQLPLPPTEAEMAPSPWLQQQYDIAVLTLRHLGLLHDWRPREIAPPIETVQAAVAPHESWLNERRKQGAKDRLVIVPDIEILQLDGTQRHPGLVRRLNNAYHRQMFVWSKLWDQLFDTEQSHEQSLQQPHRWQAAVVLGDQVDHRDAGSNTPPEAGLLYANQSLETQLQALRQERLEHAVQGRDIQSISVGQYVMVLATQLEQGEVPYDAATTLTRLISYPVYPVGRFLRIPYLPAASMTRGLVGSGMHVDDDGRRGEGVRRALNLPISPSEHV